MKKKYRVLLYTLVLVLFAVSRFVMIGNWLETGHGQNPVYVYGDIILFTLLEGILVVLLCIQIARSKKTVSVDDPDDGYVSLHEFKKRIQEERCQSD